MSALRPAAGFYDEFGAPLLGQYQESVTSDTGFGLIIASVPAGLPAAAAGYIGTDSKMHAFSVEITGAVGAYKFLEPRPSILRSTCTLRGRQRDELEVRGGCIMPANGNSLTVTLHYQTSAGATLSVAGTATCDSQGVIDPSGAQEGLVSIPWISSPVGEAGAKAPNSAAGTMRQAAKPCHSAAAPAARSSARAICAASTSGWIRPSRA